MGIRGLATYLNNPANTGNLKQCFQVIHEFPPECEVIIDGNALLYFIISNSGMELCAIKSGGSYFRFETELKKWLQEFQRLTGARLTIFCDGHDEQPDKAETHLQRELEKMNNIYGMSQSLQDGGKFVCAKKDLGARINVAMYLACVSSVCIELKIDIICCNSEADYQIAKTVKLNQYYACFSQDSDFYCLGAPYIPLDSIKMGGDSITAHLFEAEPLIRSLGIPTVEHLKFLACLVGNDYFFGTDRYCVHQALGLPISATAGGIIIDLVCLLLSKYQTAAEFSEHCEKLRDAASQNDLPIWNKFFNALKNYDLQSCDQEQEISSAYSVKKRLWNSLDQHFINYTVFGSNTKVSTEETKNEQESHVDSKFEHYACANAHVLLPRLSAKLYSRQKHKRSCASSDAMKEPFQFRLSAQVLQPQPNCVSLDIEQIQDVLRFQPLRMRIISCFLGQDHQVKQKMLLASGDWELSCKTTKLNLPQVDMERFLMLIDENVWTAIDVSLYMFQHGKIVTFGLLVLRCLSRVMKLTEKEKYAIFLHFHAQPNNIPISAFASASGPQSMDKWMEDDWIPSPRSFDIARTLQTCYTLCLDASLGCFGLFFYSILAVPSAGFDAERLIGELEECDLEIPPEIAILFAAGAEDNLNCQFGSQCRLVECKAKHADDVWGQCRFDGMCKKNTCTDRHIKQSSTVSAITTKALCKFDGKCFFYGKCHYHHVQQTEPYKNPQQQQEQQKICFFGENCTRRPNCAFLHLTN